MPNKSIISSIIGVLVAVTLGVALSVGVTLYLSAVKSNELALKHIASTTSRLIASVAAFDRIYSDIDFDEGAVAATLSQIDGALGGEAGFGETGEILLLTMEGDNIRVLVHQVSDDSKEDHPDVVEPGSLYYEALKGAFSAKADLIETEDLVGHTVALARVLIDGTDWALVVEKHKFEIQAPFISAAQIGGVIAFVLIIVGSFLNYRSGMNLSHRAREAEQIAKKAFTESQRVTNRLQDALNVTREGFALFDKDDRLVVCNDIYREFYSTHKYAIQEGNTLEEILRAGVAEGAFPEAIGREDAWIKERIAQHQATETIEQQLADGRWLQISEQRTHEGGIVGVRTDITELKNRERALLESEKRYKDFTKTASDWTWETDAEHRFSISNRGNRGKEEFDVSLVKMKRRQEVAAEDTTTIKWERHQKALDAHLPFDDFQYWTIAPNNSKRLISVSGVPVFDENGVFKGYRGTGRDVTGDYLTSQKIKAAEERLRLAFENVTIGIVLADNKGRITAFNNAAQQIFGYSSEEVLGKNVSILATDEDRSRHDLYIENYQETGEAKIIGIGREVFGQRKNGQKFPINLGIGEMEVDGKVQYVASLMDLSSEKLLEEKLRQSQKMDAVGQLVGGVAHDFNNLLGIIMGNLDLMRRKVEPGSRMEKQVTKALGAAERGANLTRRLLNFSRQMPTETMAMDVNETIKDLYDLIQKALTDKVAMQLKLSNRLPFAYADKGDFEDAITNLCINARDAMPDGGNIVIETAKVEIAGGQYSELKDLEPGGYIEIDISDTGTGMSHEVASKIFDPFFSTKEKGKGTGLGLSMVYGFAKRSGGLISVYSEVGVGTTFKLFLPVATDEINITNSDTSEKSDAIDCSGTEKILIVDDEVDLAEIAESILSDLGYRTLKAHNGQDALDIMKKDRTIDLLLTDVIMPGGIDGYQLAKQAQQVNPKLKICMASGFTGMAIENNSHSRTDFPLIKKPYSNDDLARRVRSILDAN